MPHPRDDPPRRFPDQPVPLAGATGPATNGWYRAGTGEEIEPGYFLTGRGFGQ